MKRLLIAYDGSRSADNMLAELQRAGLPTELDVVVLSVADVWLPPDGSSPPPGRSLPMIEAAHAEARRALEISRQLADGAAARVRELFPRWRVEAAACADAPAWAILKRAETWPADLIALGAQGHTLLERFFLGSVSHKVAAEARCSVHISRTRVTEPAGAPRLMIALDGSPDSEAALRIVLARFWPPGTACDIVSAIEPRSESAAAWSGAFLARWAPGPGTNYVAAVDRLLADAAEKTRAAGLTPEVHPIAGDPKHVLPKHAVKSGAHLLFLGARGLHHQRRQFLGNVAASIAARVTCSVEIVRSAD